MKERGSKVDYYKNIAKCPLLSYMEGKEQKLGVDDCRLLQDHFRRTAETIESLGKEMEERKKFI